MNKAIKTTDCSNYIIYCNNECIKLSSNIDNKIHNELKIHRGEYKGFLYIKKIISYLVKQKRRIMVYELYNLIKVQKNSLDLAYDKRELQLGIYKSLNSFLNYIATPVTNAD